MATKKEPIGFSTSAKTVEQKYEELQRSLAGTKTDWGQVQEAYSDISGLVKGMVDAFVTKEHLSTPADIQMAIVIMGLANSAILGRMVSLLGVSLTQTREELANVGKAMQEVKLALGKAR